mmetsp:Transcript_16655/g.29747  ORF Transcript_16655/g.29747 Transcript_16655/m.29747 type:complete len:95 (-) Transcript_16655:946-1230(-)
MELCQSLQLSFFTHEAWHFSHYMQGARIAEPSTWPGYGMGTSLSTAKIRLATVERKLAFHVVSGGWVSGQFFYLVCRATCCIVFDDSGRFQKHM